MTHVFLRQLAELELTRRTGRVRKILPTYLEADGPVAGLGALCAVETVAGDAMGPSTVLAEVVGLRADAVVLAPLEDAAGVAFGAKVTALTETARAPVGDGFLGRAVDALAAPLDGGPPIAADAHAPLAGRPTPILDRTTTGAVLRTGLRAIDGLVTLGVGQRVGVFAASGVGKSSLVTQLARQVEADICVVCLVGERGREVEALWSRGLTPEARARTVLVAATSDQSAALRARACDQALALCEYWRDRGLKVLFLLDSVTRLAMALREMGLAAGEPPTVRAYTPRVFAALPRLVERCGALTSGGAITAIMTVLAETDEVDDPISETMKSLLDGHIVLSRALAELGHFPAIDIPRSVSRLAQDLVDPESRAQAAAAAGLLATYDTARTLIESGVYAAGADSQIDEAIARRPGLMAFLRQTAEHDAGLAETRQRLAEALGGGRA